MSDEEKGKIILGGEPIHVQQILLKVSSVKIEARMEHFVRAVMAFCAKLIPRPHQISVQKKEVMKAANSGAFFLKEVYYVDLLLRQLPSHAKKSFE